jgi:hypothetical protein
VGVVASATATPTAAAVATPTATPEITPEPTATATPTVEPTVPPLPPTKPKTYPTPNSRQWAQIVKSPDKYFGNGYHIWACITQFDAATGTDTFRGDASYKKQEYWALYGDNSLFTGNQDRLSDFVTNDIVVMNVTSLGSFSYDTQIGGNTTVPLFQVDSIAHKGSCE